MHPFSPFVPSSSLDDVGAFLAFLDQEEEEKEENNGQEQVDEEREEEEEVSGDHKAKVEAVSKEPLSDYDLLRLRNIAERQRLWKELKKEASEISKAIKRPRRRRRRVDSDMTFVATMMQEEEDEQRKIPEREEPVMTRARAR